MFELPFFLVMPATAVSVGCLMLAIAAAISGFALQWGAADD